MRKLIVGLMIVILLAGCSSDLTFTEVDINRVNKDVKEFMNAVQDENGTHLYHDSKRNMYVFLNSGNVIQGSKVAHFSDFNLKANGDTLNVIFHHESTDDYSNPDLNYQMLYKVKLDKTYDKIMLFDNDEETAFHTIYN